jgi:hypothetical protein
MNKLELFLSKHGIKIILIFTVLTYFKSCSVNSELNKVKKELKSAQTTISNLPTRKDLEIEGLKAEKRMIQSTDRTMMDVNRQSEIDTEIKKIESTK